MHFHRRVRFVRGASSCGAHCCVLAVFWLTSARDTTRNPLVLGVNVISLAYALSEIAHMSGLDSQYKYDGLSTKK
jgi:hypothetical protein